MNVSSSAFENEGIIPSEFTCDGQDLSPPLSIINVPKDAKLDLKQGSDVKELQNAMSGHIVAEAVLMGKYSRR